MTTAGSGLGGEWSAGPMEEAVTGRVLLSRTSGNWIPLAPLGAMTGKCGNAETL